MGGAFLLFFSRGGGPSPVNGGVGGLGAFLLFKDGGGKGTSSTPCMGLGGFLLSAQGGGYGGSGLSAAQASDNSTARVMIGITL